MDTFIFKMLSQAIYFLILTIVLSCPFTGEGRGSEIFCDPQFSGAGMKPRSSGLLTLLVTCLSVCIHLPDLSLSYYMAEAVF